MKATENYHKNILNLITLDTVNSVINITFPT